MWIYKNQKPPISIFTGFNKLVMELTVGEIKYIALSLTDYSFIQFYL